MNSYDRASREIIDLHDFFVRWFNGTADRDQLELRFLSRLHPNLLFVSPEGQVITTRQLRVGFESSFGSNPNFNIQIRDVDIRYERGDLVLASYTEWQTGSVLSADTNNARVTSVLLEMTDPVTWLHLHETWLPESVRVAGSFDF